MGRRKKPKKYNVPVRKLSPIHIVYIGSIGGLLLTMALTLIVLPNMNKSDPVHVFSGVPFSEASGESVFSRPKSALFSVKTPDSTPSATSSQITSDPEPASSVSTQSKPESSPASAHSSSEKTSSSAGSAGSSKSSSRQSSRSSQATQSPQSSQTSLSSQATQSSHSSQASQATPQSSSTEPIEITDPVFPDEVVYNKDGIVIVGTRAMALYGANSSNFKKYAEAVNKYKEALPDVNVYSMVIPTACEFYTPPSLAEMSSSQLYHIDLVKNDLKDVRFVDAYSALAAHSDENIYLRTDHHWAPLGGYYAAQAFAEAADVPFLPLSDYKEHVNKGFCGTMYGYTENSEYLKSHPEDFVYHVPQTVDWTTTYINYKISDWDLVSADEPVKAAYFLDYGDNGSNNYCTFMAGDAKIVHVETSTKNGRRLAIIKDSFGNTIPGYLFGSFEEIYIMDLRFFSHNMIDYLKEKQITDLLFANNTTVAGNKAMSDNLDTIRTQEDMGF